MAKALFFIFMFLITVCGVLLFTPTNQQPETREEKKNVAAKMAEFLEKNPQIVQREIITKPISTIPEEEPVIPPHTSPHPVSEYQVEIQFQGSLLQFKTMTEMDHWIFESVTKDALGFLSQLKENDNPELYLDVLLKVTEINSDADVIEKVKTSYLDEAKKLIEIKDGFHQQMAQKAIENYFQLEKDKSKAKKIVDEIFK